MQTSGVTISFKELLRLKSLAIKIQKKDRAKHLYAGAYLSGHRGRGMDFDAVRLYQPGDDIRHLDWNVTARTNKAHTKVYCEEKECPVIILIDFNSSLFFGTRNVFKSVLSAQVSALLAWSSLAQGDRVGGLLQTPKQQYWFKPKAHHAGIVPLLKTLSEMTHNTFEQSNYTLQRLVKNFTEITQASTTLYLISDFYYLDNNTLKQLTHLSQHHSLILCHLYDPLEQHPPPPNYYRFSNGSKNNLMNLFNTSERKKFQQPFQERLEKLHSFCKKNKVKLFELGTHQDLKKSLLRHF